MQEKDNIFKIDYKKKLLSMLGFAKKSGNIIHNTEKVLEYLRKKGKIKLVLIASDCGKSQYDKIISKCVYYNTKYFSIFDRVELSKAIGSINSVCIGITDENFAKVIEDLINKLNYENGG